MYDGEKINAEISKTWMETYENTDDFLLFVSVTCNIDKQLYQAILNIGEARVAYCDYVITV